VGPSLRCHFPYIYTFPLPKGVQSGLFFFLGFVNLVYTVGFICRFVCHLGGGSILIPGTTALVRSSNYHAGEHLPNESSVHTSTPGS
jgi:hypothetical protein